MGNAAPRAFVIEPPMRRKVRQRRYFFEYRRANATTVSAWVGTSRWIRETNRVRSPLTHIHRQPKRLIRTLASSFGLIVRLFLANERIDEFLRGDYLHVPVRVKGKKIVVPTDDIEELRGDGAVDEFVIVWIPGDFRFP